MRRPKREGFTVVELVVTLVIVAVIATIALNWLWRAKDRAFESYLQSDLRSLAIQQEVYFSKHRVYGGSLADLTEFSPSPSVIVTLTYGAQDGWAATAVHPGRSEYQCGIRFGEAPADAAPPALRAAVVTCGSP